MCHLADVHLGYRRYSRLAKNGVNQRELDVSIAFQEAISRVITLKPDLTVVAGDLFHSVRPSNQVVTFCFRQLRKLARESGAPVIIVGGNHEAPKRVDTGSVLQLLGEVEGVYVADTSIETFTFADKSLAVTCVPHLALVDEVGQEMRPELSGAGAVPSDPEREGRAIRMLLKGGGGLRAVDTCKHNILVVHAQVNEGWVSDFGGVELDLRSLNPHEWDYIALGHVHVHRSVGFNAAYAGSLEHTATNIWGEAKELKGFLEVALPGAKRTFHPLTSPREVLSLEPIEAKSLPPEELMASIVSRTESVPGGLDGKIVRLEIRGLSRETYRHLDHKVLRSLRAQALHLTIDLSFATTTGESSLVGKPGTGSLREELRAFCSAWEAPGIQPKEIHAILDHYVGKVEASYEVA